MTQQVIRRTALLVEGHTDLEFFGKLLRKTIPGLERIKQVHDLDDFWKKLTALDFPQDGDLTKRMDVPGFFASGVHSIAVVSANSIEKLVSAGSRLLFMVGPELPDSIGFILDADEGESPADRFTNLLERVVASGRYDGVSLPEALGHVSEGSCRSGVYIMPDNQATGTLEDVLLACGAINYPQLAERAEAFVSEVDLVRISNSEKRGEIDAPSGRKKARASAMSAILKPAKSLQVSIHDNRWLDGAALALPEVVAMRRFLRDLFDEPSIFPESPTDVLDQHSIDTSNT